MLVSSLLVTATSMSASSAPAWRSTVGNEARPCTVRMSSRSPRSRRRSQALERTGGRVLALFPCRVRDFQDFGQVSSALERLDVATLGHGTGHATGETFFAVF